MSVPPPFHACFAVILQANDDVVRAAFRRLTQPAKGATYTPAELVVLLNQSDARVPIKSMTRALTLCLENKVRCRRSTFSRAPSASKKGGVVPRSSFSCGSCCKFSPSRPGLIMIDFECPEKSCCRLNLAPTWGGLSYALWFTIFAVDIFGEGDVLSGAVRCGVERCASRV